MTPTHPESELVALVTDPVTMLAMARAFKAAHDEHAAARIPKIYAAGQREEANVIVGLHAALEVLTTRAATVPQGVSVPDGWVLVPRESTSAMDWAGAEAAGEPFTGPDAERVWIAMIAAATTPPPAELGKGDSHG